jgi:hypothetical protein
LLIDEEKDIVSSEKKAAALGIMGSFMKPVVVLRYNLVQVIRKHWKRNGDYEMA